MIYYASLSIQISKKTSFSFGSSKMHTFKTNQNHSYARTALQSYMCNKFHKKSQIQKSEANFPYIHMLDLKNPFE